MRIFDRYLLRQFFLALAICLVSMTGLYVVIDAFTNLDRFVSYAEGRSSVGLVMASYYGHHALAFFDRTSGVVTLLAAMFTIALLQRNAELTALLAAGISKRRVVAPVLIAAAGVSMIAVVNRELVIPRFRERLGRSVKEVLSDRPRDLTPRYDNKTDILLRGATTLAREHKIARPDFLLPAGLDDHGKRLAADEAVYLPAAPGRPAGYLLVGVSEPADLAVKSSVVGPDGPVILTPLDHPWLEAGQAYVASDVNVEMIEGGYAWKNFSTTAELVRGLENRSLDFGADVRVAIHGRLVQPLLDMTLLMIGLPLVLGRGDRNVVATIGLCVGVSVLFLLAVLACQSLGNSYLISPALAAWLPLILFVPFAAGMAEPLVE